MLIAFIVVEVFEFISVCWEYSSDFELFDIWKVTNIDLNGNRTSGGGGETSIYLCFRYIKFDISEFI